MKFRVITLTFEDDSMSLPKEWLDAIARVNASLDALPARIDAAVTAAVAAATASGTGITAADVTQGASDLGAVADRIDAIDIAPPVTTTGDVPATPPGETAVPTF